MPYFLVERDFPDPVPPSRVEEVLGSMRFCLDAWRIRHVESYVSTDGRRVFCVFEAADAEAMTAGNSAAAMPVTSVREVTLHLPPEGREASEPRT